MCKKIWGLVRGPCAVPVRGVDCFGVPPGDQLHRPAHDPLQVRKLLRGHLVAGYPKNFFHDLTSFRLLLAKDIDVFMARQKNAVILDEIAASIAVCYLYIPVRHSAIFNMGI